MTTGVANNNETKRILLTGATGFLGSVLWRQFMMSGYDVVALKRSTSDLSRVADLVKNFSIVDVDSMSWAEIFSISRPDIVVHTACCYGRCGESSVDMVASNVIFPLGLIEQCAINGTFFLNTSSLLAAKVNAYSMTKSHIRQWLDCHANMLPSVSLRLDHLYGPGDSDKKFIGWLLGCFASGVPAVSLTAGEQTRDFIHVDDAADLFCFILEHRQSVQGHAVIPAGSGREIRLRDFVLLLAELWQEQTGKPLGTRLDFGSLPYRPGEAMRTVIPPVLMGGTRWEPRRNLEHGLRQCIRWFIATKQRAAVGCQPAAPLG